MKLTEPQIQELYKFTRKHFVEWYDLQTELVDHLANGIEQQWQEHPKRTFDDAIKVEFKKFGVFGFMDVVEQRQKALSKKYLNMLFKFVKEWFRLPKIIVSITATYLVFLLYSSSLGNYFYYSLLSLICLFIFIKSYQLNKQFKTREKATGRKWLLQEMIFKSSSANILVLFVNMYNIYNLSDVSSSWAITILAAVTTLMILVAYITLVVIPSKAEKLLEETYPEYKIA